MEGESLMAETSNIGWTDSKFGPPPDRPRDGYEASEGGHCFHRFAHRCAYLQSRAGTDMDEWPKDLRVQEFPE